MLRGALRRIAAIVAVVVGGTAAISAALGALAGRSILHSLAIGFYLAGAGFLFGSLALGSRGPMRVDRSVEGDLPLRERRRSVRKATPEERREGRRASLGLFAFGLLLVLVGAALDPTRRLF